MSSQPVTAELARRIARDTRRVFEQIDGGTKRAARKLGATCKKGCAHCCYLLALISLQDALVVAERVLGFEEWEPWLPRLRESAQRADYDGMSTENYFDKQIRCAFLKEDNTCAVYSARPAPCRLHLVVSDPSHCAPDSPDGVIRSVDFREVEMQFFNNTVATESGVPLMGSIPLMTLVAMALLTQEDPARHPKIMAALEGLPSPSEWLGRHHERIRTLRRKKLDELNEKTGETKR